MIRSLKYNFVLIVGCVLVVVSLGTNQAHATSVASSGITVSPGFLNFTLDGTADSKTVPLFITNNYDSAVDLGAEFKGIDENAGVLLPADSLDHIFGSTLAISETDIRIAPHSTEQLTVQANDIPALSPGGHYATLVLTQQETTANQLSLRTAASLGVYVVKTQGAHLNVRLNSYLTNHWVFGLPTKATLSFTNTGNVLAVPRAAITVVSDDGQTILLKGIGNIDSTPLLPGKSLTDIAVLSGLTHTWLPQRLSFVVTYRADGQENTKNVTAVFWYIPSAYLWLLIPISLLILSAIKKAYRRAHPLPKDFTRMRPLSMYNLLERSKRIISVIDEDPAEPAKVVVTKPFPQLKTAATSKPKSKATVKTKAKKATSKTKQAPTDKLKTKRKSAATKAKKAASAKRTTKA